jgi:hypothetical protein
MASLPACGGNGSGGDGGTGDDDARGRTPRCSRPCRAPALADTSTPGDRDPACTEAALQAAATAGG